MKGGCRDTAQLLPIVLVCGTWEAQAGCKNPSLGNSAALGQRPPELYPPYLGDLGLGQTLADSLAAVLHRVGGWTWDVPQTQDFYASLFKNNWFSCFCVSSSCFCAVSAALSSPAYEISVFPTATVMQSSRGGGSSEEEHRNPLRQQEMPGQMGAKSPSEPSRHCSMVNYYSSCSQVLRSSLLLKPTPQRPYEVSAHRCCAHLPSSCPAFGIDPLQIHQPLANAASQILPSLPHRFPLPKPTARC